MEVGQAGSRMTAPHYTSRWDAMAERETIYSTGQWRDRSLGAIGASTHAWSAAMAAPAGTSPSLSPYSSLPSPVMDGVVDKVLYHNLVEMIPLVETLMEQQQQPSNKSFPRHASVVYTPSPDTLKGSEHSFKGKRRSGQLFGDKQWLGSPADNKADRNSHSNAMISQLQDQMEQLELKLQEKDGQLQAAESSIQQSDLRLQANIEELQGQISLKEMEIHKAAHQLSKQQNEVASLQSLLREAESEVAASMLTAAKVHEESQNLQCQVAAVLLWMENISSCQEDQTADTEAGSLPTMEKLIMENKEADQKYSSDMLQSDPRHAEMIRRNYLASLVAARHNPTDELLLLIAELRGQLQACVMHPNALQLT